MSCIDCMGSAEVLRDCRRCLVAGLNKLADDHERAKALLARAHGLLEGRTHVLEHEIASFLGWPAPAPGPERSDQ